MNFMKKAGKLLDCYIYIIMIVFPLFMWNRFIDIKESKAIFFLVASGIFFVLTAFVAGKEKGRPFYLWKEHKFYLLFVGVGLIGLIFSDYPASAFTGDYGRYNGLLVAIVYLLVGSMIIAYGKFKEGFRYGFEISGAIVCLFGVLNHYGIDPLHVYDNILKKVAKMYLSTFGHVNIYTSFLAILLPVYAVSFYTAKKRWQKIVHMAGYCFASYTLLVSGSDSGYLALAALWGVLIVHSFCTKKGRKRVLALLLAFMVVTAVTGVIHALTSTSTGKKKKLDSISKAIITLDFERVSAYFDYNDDWGNGRGFIWNRGLAYYQKLPLHQKLVGIGPDLLLPAMIDYCGEESKEKYDVYYDNMHNELFQYLITYGALGLVFLILWTVKTAKDIYKHAGSSPICLMVFTMMMCYGLQSLVNIETISVKGILIVWIFLAKSTYYFNNSMSSIYQAKYSPEDALP